MSRKGRRVSFSPDVNEKPVIFLKHGGGGGGGNRGNRKRVVVAGIWSFRVSKDSGFSAMRFLRRLRTKVVRAISVVSMSSSRSSRKVSSSNLTRSRSVSDPLDSHRAEALEDCIEFLNSSSSLQRSNSVSSSCC
ncbi:josephin-like protein [Ziziphus jujuba]|uniref:Josephin-like protein n=1 Tax=Ziziphus jujuba TaxID=326968 RepID=A0A6P4ALX1_ZIZJJ|nr:josephin-like protein [Ziziphus jujuba]